MHVSHFRRLAILFSCVALCWSSGCAEFGPFPSWLPFSGQAADDSMGIVTPAERIATLREMGKNAQQSDTTQSNTIDALARAMQSEPDMLIRSEIVRTAGKHSGEKAAALLHTGLIDSAAEVRIAACEGLAGRGDSRSVGLLADTLDGDLDTDVRLAAAAALGNTANQKALAALAPSLQDVDPAIQRRVALSMERISGQNLSGNVYRWQEYAKRELPETDREISTAQRSGETY
jgi:HEAT repeat protein